MEPRELISCIQTRILNTANHSATEICSLETPNNTKKKWVIYTNIFFPICLCQTEAVSDSMKVVRKAHWEKLRENRVGVGERRCNRACKHRFQFVFPVNQTLLHRTFWRFDIWHFDSRNGFWESRRIFEVFEKMLSGSPLLFSHRFPPVRYLTTRSLVSLVCTDREPGTGYLCH